MGKFVKSNGLIKDLKKDWPLYLILAPGMLFFFDICIFAYAFSDSIFSKLQYRSGCFLGASL